MFTAFFENRSDDGILQSIRESPHFEDLIANVRQWGYYISCTLTSPTGGGRSVGIVRSRTKKPRSLVFSLVLNFIILLEIPSYP